MHPFRFGVRLESAPSAEAWANAALRAESLGYDTLLASDHLGSRLAPVAALSFAAAATTRLRIGTFVLANDFRHPVVVAQEAATLSLLSRGRFELGLGAGWDVDDYLKLGRPYDPPAVRIERLAESVPLIRRLLSGEVVDHAGPHYQLRGAHVAVGTTPASRPPLLIGGGGSSILRLAAHEADIVGLHPRSDPRRRRLLGEVTDATTARKIAMVREAAGERFEQLEFNVSVGHAILLGDRRRTRRSIAAEARAVASERAGVSYVLRGSLADLREGLLRRRDQLGISYYAMPGYAMENMAPLVAALAGR